MSRTRYHNSARLHDHRSGFTLAEVIVAIAILAIIGVVVGSIFASVGDTVTNGRQVSNLNRFVARVERVMRNDFENMVRDNGFMVIRNEITHRYDGVNPTRQPVALTPTDGNRRPRRIDEIMFFSRDEFTSRRAPLHPEMIARANVARVYYGHGQQMPEDLGGNPDTPDYTTRYARPRLDETMANVTVDGSAVDTRLGVPSGLGVVNPNEFAADWSLLRHVTLLVPRASGVQDLPDNVFGLQPNLNRDDYYRVSDMSRQVALAPAAQSIFNSISNTRPYEIANWPTDAQYVEDPPSAPRSIRENEFSVLGSGGPFDGTLIRPLATSGLVDIAVTDLDEIRRTVVHTMIGPAGGGADEFTPVDVNAGFAFGGAFPRSVLDSQRNYYDTDGTPYIGTTQLDYNTGGVFENNPQFDDQAQQRWMLDALPSVPFSPQFPGNTGQRMRFEDVPPRAYFDEGVNPDLATLRQMAIEQADQEMLASSVFVPRCTEFIVEFSFGIVDRRLNLVSGGENPNYGQQIWHGLRREVDGRILVDGFGTLYANEALLDAPNLANDPFAITGAFPATSFEDGNRVINTQATDGGFGFNGIDQEIIDLVWVREDPAITAPQGNETIAQYCFGYTYRDWNLDEDGDGFTAGDGDDVEREWPWPTMVRVTMRFVDPADLEDEQTFQFEFRVPGVGGRL